MWRDHHRVYGLFTSVAEILAGLNDAEALYLAAQGILVDTKFPGRCNFFPLISLERLKDDLLFDFS